MGTHPIFESDFDCLTEMTVAIVESGKSKLEEREVEPVPMECSNEKPEVPNGEMETEPEPEADTETGSVIPLFGKLSNLSPETRIEAAAEFVKIIKNGTEENLEYSLNRLVKGLAANKGWSRPGFTMALISILKNCEKVKVAVLIEKMEKFLDYSNDNENEKGIILGKTFCLAAIIKSKKGNLA